MPKESVCLLQRLSTTYMLPFQPPGSSPLLEKARTPSWSGPNPCLSSVTSLTYNVEIVRYFLTSSSLILFYLPHWSSVSTADLSSFQAVFPTMVSVPLLSDTLERQPPELNLQTQRFFWASGLWDFLGHPAAISEFCPTYNSLFFTSLAPSFFPPSCYKSQLYHIIPFFFFFFLTICLLSRLQVLLRLVHSCLAHHTFLPPNMGT